MTTIVEFETAASDIALRGVFDELSSITCSVEQVITSTGRGLWFERTDRSALERALEADSTVRSYSMVVDSPDRLLYDVSVAESAFDVFEIVGEEGGTMLSAGASDGRWHFRTRFTDREDASQLYDRLEASTVETTLLRLTELREAPTTMEGLTEKQYETLLTALERGYFTIPREISMEELAAELGVSHQALSERFRRAYRAIVQTELNGAVRVDSSVEPMDIRER